MRFLASILWILVLAAAGIFIYNNWIPITLRLWNDQVMDTYLPIPMIAAFLLGVLPYFILHRATRWSLRRKLAQAERALATVNQPIQAPVNAPHSDLDQSAAIVGAL